MNLFGRSRDGRPYGKRQEGFAHRVTALRRTLESNYSRSQTNHHFVHPEKTKTLISRKDISDLFDHMPWYQKNHDELWNNMRLIVSILISTGWDTWHDWEDFPRLFFRYESAKVKHARVLDVHLPLTVEIFPALSSSSLARFQTNQYIFCPVVILEGSHCQYSSDHRLPILRVDDVRAAGAQGVVEKVTIEANFLQYADQISNQHPKVMAYKRIPANTDDGVHNFRTEQKVLQHFFKSVSQNQNIMKNFASFVHGSDFVILTPWADGLDLNIFLTRPEDIFGAAYEKRSNGFSPDNLLTEAFYLAKALQFLHFELINDRGRSITCAHLDLKPENILVVLSQNESVGKWKISDFGLSNVEVAVTENHLMPVGRKEQGASRAPGNIVRERSLQPRRRGPGPFQPPEVENEETAKVSTKRDVWSYGCILMMVLAFAIRGPIEVVALGRLRGTGGDDYFYSRLKGGRAAMLKHGVETWLSTSYGRDDVHQGWIRPCIDLIRRLLDENVVTRPEIDVAWHGLKRIFEMTEHFKSRIWTWNEQRYHDQATSDRRRVPSFVPQDGNAQHSGPATPPGTPSPQLSHSPASAIYQSPGSNQSPTTWHSLSTKGDSTLKYGRLTNRRRNTQTGAALDPYGGSAVLWSDREINLYVLRADMRLDETMSSANSLIDLPMGSREVISDLIDCKQVAVCGQWFASINGAGQGPYQLTTYYRPLAHGAKCDVWKRVALPRDPERFVVSSQGAVAAKCHHEILVHTNTWSTTIRSYMTFSGMAFSGNGEYFCLWERDMSFSYWTIWSTATGAMLCNTIHHPLSTSALARDSELLLLPFRSWPRFIAYDHQQNLYLIRADAAESARVHKIGSPIDIIAGAMLPDDEAFVLLRNVPKEKTSTISKGFLNLVDEPSCDLRTFGKINRYIRPEGDVLSTSTGGEDAGGPFLLVLSRSGSLIRKAL